MYELIVLGLVPGTQWQINFATWLSIAGGILLAIVIVKAYRKRNVFRNWFIGWRLLALTRRQLQTQ